MTGPTLLAVAHGSRHPAAAATITALVRQVERLAPVLDIQVAFVQHAEPTLADALDAAGQDLVIVPLLLSTGYHLTTDIRGAVTANETASAAGVTGPRGTVLRVAGPDATPPRVAAPPGAGPRVAGPLGPDQLLVTALSTRLAEAGAPPGTPVVLAAAGSSDPLAAAQVEAQAELLADDLGVPVVPAFAAAERPRHMCSMTLSPNCEHLISVAPSIKRAKSYVTRLLSIAPLNPLRIRSAASVQPM